MRVAPSFVLLLAAAPITTAATIHVPGDQPTIQAGINAAAAGDTVEVACGTYYEHDIVIRSGITLRSESGNAGCCTIDAQWLGRILFGEGLDGDTRVEGLTFTRGEAIPGGAVRVVQSSLRIHGCVFRDNHSTEVEGV